MTHEREGWELNIPDGMPVVDPEKARAAAEALTGAWQRFEATPGARFVITGDDGKPLSEAELAEFRARLNPEKDQNTA